jgi:hypothetical protein
LLRFLEGLDDAEAEPSTCIWMRLMDPELRTGLRVMMLEAANGG